MATNSIIDDPKIIIYRGVGSYDVDQKKAYYSVILPKVIDSSIYRFKNKVYNLSKTKTDYAILVFMEVDGIDSDLSGATEIMVKEIVIDLSDLINISNTNIPEEIILADTPEITVIVMHDNSNETEAVDYARRVFYEDESPVIPKKHGLGTIKYKI